MRTAAELLAAKAALYAERNKLYGDNYKRHGLVMAALFPNGVTLHTVEDHNRFGLITQIISKLTRYTNQFTQGGHEDSLRDLQVYGAMLEEVDLDIADLMRALGDDA